MNCTRKALETFSDGEKICYRNFTAKDKSAYSAYVSATSRYNVTKELMTPSEWAFQRDERETLMDFDDIAKKLGLGSASNAYSYYKSGLRHILKAIKANPKKYSALTL